MGLNQPSMKKSPYLLALAAARHQMKMELHPSVPRHAVPRTAYNDATANGLTKCILDFVNLQEGAAAWRQSNAPVYDARFGGFRSGTVSKGVSDISAIREGIAWQIEVKVGRDKMSEHQRRFSESVAASGGRFIIARDFAGFVRNWSEAAPIRFQSQKTAEAWNDELRHDPMGDGMKRILESAGAKVVDTTGINIKGKR